MTTEQPLVSIVMPTRNRSHLLRYALESALSQKDVDGLEIVVSDNCSRDDTSEYVSSIGDPRVRLVRPPHSLSMSSHWEFAFDQAKGEFVTFLCDDDSMCSDAIAEALAVLRDTQLPLVVKGGVQYCGSTAPDVVRRNSLAVPGYTNKVKVLKSQDTVRELRSPRCKMELPLMLNSLCRRDVCLRAREKAGRLFVRAPDYCFALTTLAMIDEWCVLDKPLRLMGAFSESIGIAQIQNRGTAAQTFLAEHRKEEIQPLMPLDLNIVTNIVANTFRDVKSRISANLTDYDVDLVEYYAGCWEDLLRLKDHGVDVSADTQTYATALAAESADLRKAVLRRNCSLKGRSWRFMRNVAYRSRLLFKLGMLATMRGWAYWGDQCGFADILGATGFLETLRARSA
jgi:hypothetical protein